MEMFEAAGLSIAMGNAREDVKAKASFVTTSNDEEGVAFAIKNIIIPDFLERGWTRHQLKALFRLPY